MVDLEAAGCGAGWFEAPALAGAGATTAGWVDRGAADLAVAAGWAGLEADDAIGPEIADLPGTGAKTADAPGLEIAVLVDVDAATGAGTDLEVSKLT